MKKLIIFPFLLLAMACTVDDPEPKKEPGKEPRDPEIVVSIDENTSIVFTPKEEAAEKLGTSDSYTKALTKFDLASRTKNKNSTQEQDYLTFASNQAQAWTDEEKTVLEARILGIKDKIDALGLKLEFPEEILLIKSTLDEEGGATSYTRENYIVVKGLASEAFLIHELFHILTRHSEEKRTALFETINFNKSNRIVYPEGIRDLVITNPDAPFLEHTINLEIEGATQEVVFILIAEEAWDGGSFFTYIKQRLMFVEGGANDKKATLVDNMPVLKNFGAATDLKEKIGDNTDYTLHPEEILADHFVMLVQQKTVPEPAYINAMKAVLVQE
ncbi:hypothetical protein [uncultured Cyclobacterium sp.]|uniref:hypothetical protein n=1 Tax=uncultured Cyclobacterium sp. TaxID=453820 RepID=UPI0030EB6599|tara:strand:+ start:10582 stop:11571 length:990 start_codon:yes stop_codon:yes gene_type:complete